MKIGDFVLVQLTNPREKFWGILKEKDTTGITVRGLTLDGFEGWLREIAHKEPPSFFPSTVFFPLPRVERIFADETAGEALSFADRFRRTVGEDARYYLTPVPDSLDEEGEN
jgi:hypothetical protein